MIALTNLLVALVMVESAGAPHPARGDGGRAIGPLQIHRVAVEDANRILGFRRFRWEDCERLEPSLEVATVILTYYGERLPHPPTLQDLARIWNGGPTGWRERSTIPYWRRVERQLRQIHHHPDPPVRIAAG